MVKNYLSELYTKSSFNRKSKTIAYLFIAIIIGIVQVLEDVADNDTELESITREFAIIVVTLIIVLPVLGWAFRSLWKAWKKNGVLANWFYSDIVFVIACLVIFPLILLMLAYPTFFVDNIQDVWVVWASSLIFVSIVIAIEVFWIMIERRLQLEAQNAHLRRNEEMTKYQALMNQLNPHFLFNSLNVLSYLVYKNPRNAEKFIEELSKIYRYIIELNETYLVPLKKELEFIDSYMYLQRIRFHNNLTYEVNIDLENYQKYIPPLTLEVLLENAVKHNVIDEQRPLHIKIHSRENLLIVENNIQLRMENKIKSTRIGLQNLIEKFEILDDEIPYFYTKDGVFIAEIPLLNTEI